MDVLPNAAQGTPATHRMDSGLRGLPGTPRAATQMPSQALKTQYNLRRRGPGPLREGGRLAPQAPLARLARNAKVTGLVAPGPRGLATC